MGRMGITELLVILAILVLLFGAKKLPQLADGMGKAIRNFKRGLNSEDEPDVTPDAAPDVTPPHQVADGSQTAGAPQAPQGKPEGQAAEPKS